MLGQRMGAQVIFRSIFLDTHSSFSLSFFFIIRNWQYLLFKVMFQNIINLRRHLSFF